LPTKLFLISGHQWPHVYAHPAFWTSTWQLTNCFLYFYFTPQYCCLNTWVCRWDSSSQRRERSQEKITSPVFAKVHSRGLQCWGLEVALFPSYCSNVCTGWHSQAFEPSVQIKGSFNQTIYVVVTIGICALIVF
jgi:hypothetical protein